MGKEIDLDAIDLRANDPVSDLDAVFALQKGRQRAVGFVFQGIAHAFAEAAQFLAHVLHDVFEALQPSFSALLGLGEAVKPGICTLGKTLKRQRLYAPGPG